MKIIFQTVPMPSRHKFRAFGGIFAAHRYVTMLNAFSLFSPLSPFSLSYALTSHSLTKTVQKYLLSLQHEFPSSPDHYIPSHPFHW